MRDALGWALASVLAGGVVVAIYDMWRQSREEKRWRKYLDGE